MNPVSAARKILSMAGLLYRHPAELPYAARWLHSHMPGHSPLYDEVPWVTFRALDWLESYLKPEMNVFEYGAGGSTLYFAKRVQRVVSVEHDQGFYELVRAMLLQRKITNCDLVLHIPEPCDEKSAPFVSHQCSYQGLCFEKYVKTIDGYPDQSFDLVMVDGRARMACIEGAVAKVKPGGAILLDNSERPGYAHAKELLANAVGLDFFGVCPWNLDVSQTSVYLTAN
jgi:hypothetical protein